MRGRDFNILPLWLGATLLFFLTIVSDQAADTATVIYADAKEGPIAFGVAEIQKSLPAATLEPATNAVESTSPSRIIVIQNTDSRLIGLLASENERVPKAMKPESYSIWITTTNGITRYWAMGADTTGAMYAALDLAEAIAQGRLSSLPRSDHAPYIEKRGIKFNIPLDARTPSYSDAAGDAWNNVETVWDFQFWKEYLDQLARDRYNVLSIWNEHPFPSMVKVPEYPDIALADIKKNTVDFNGAMDGTHMLPDEVIKNMVTIKTMSIEDKIEFWRKIMAYAHDRGIEFYIVTWNVFTYGTFGQYGITDSMENETTKDYLRKSVRSLFQAYPLLAGIGITAGEHMPNSSDLKKEEWLWQTYGLGVMDAKVAEPGRKIRLIHRTWESGMTDITSTYAPCRDFLDYEYKYSIAHMFSSAKPNFADKMLASLPAGSRTWLTLRNDDFFMTRWGDAEFAREYVKNMPGSDKVIGFMMGSSGYIWGREWMSTEPESPRQQTLAKHWFYFLLFGRLAYDPELSTDTIRRIVAQKFPIPKADDFFDGWASVSKIIPLVNQFHWQGADFQWYPEACLSAPGRKDSYGYHTVRTFIKVTPQPGTAILSIPAYVNNLLSGAAMTGTTPIEVANSLKACADDGLRKINGIDPGTNKELRLTLGDIKAVANLGYYYSEKILGATDLALFEKTGKISYKDTSLQHLQQAAADWDKYAAIISSQYTPWKSSRIGMIDVKALGKEALKDIQIAKDAGFPSPPAESGAPPDRRPH